MSAPRRMASRAEKSAAPQLIAPGELNGVATVALRLRLSRFPTANMTSVSNLIAGGNLQLPVQLVTDHASTQADSANTRYYRTANFTLLIGDIPLASVATRGQSPTVLLAADLDQTAAHQALRAFGGRDCSLVLSCELAAGSTSAKAASNIDTVLVQINLRDALVLQGDPSEYITLSAPDPKTGEFMPVPNRIEQSPSRDVTSLAAHVLPFKSGFASMASVASVSQVEHASPASLAANLNPDLGASGKIEANIAWLSAVTFIPPANTDPRVPRIDDDTQEVFKDAHDPSQYWYLPRFTLVQPTPSVGVASSPFSYRFEQMGHTSSGQPGINAIITFTLWHGMSDAASARLHALGDPPNQPIPFSNRAVSLIIPFRDGEGKTQREAFAATIAESGDKLIGTVSLIDDGARLAYGALAIMNFQSEPASVRVDTFFKAMVPTQVTQWSLNYEGKIARLSPLVVTRSFGPETAMAKTATGAVHFEREQNGAPQAQKPLAHDQTFAVHAQLHSEVVIPILNRDTVYAVRDVARSWLMDCLFPCETFGVFYVQNTPEGGIAVGCRDALKLGAIDYHEYAPLNDPGIPSTVGVYRSIFQPSRFLLVPTNYRITRFGRDAAERSYRPAAFLYSSLDADHPESNKCVLMATLAPDIAPHEHERLRELLRKYSPSPVLNYMTEIEAEVSYAWSIANSSVVRDTMMIRRWDSFLATITIDLEQAPLLESMLGSAGISVAATFTLPDKSQLQTSLSLNLNEIVGPNDSGPVAVETSAGGLTLTNKIEVDVDVDDILQIDDQAVPGTNSIITLAVEKTLKRGEPYQYAPSSALVPQTRLVPVAIPKAGSAATLTEVRSFVEDIFTEIAFINLINYANHGLNEITLQARIKDVDGVYDIATSEQQPVTEIQVVLPLTRYLAHPILEFQTTLTEPDGTKKETAWIQWPLETKGNVVGLTWDLLGNA